MSAPKAPHESKEKMTSLEDAFALRAPDPKSQNAGLARRLFDNALRPHERTRLIKIKRVKHLRESGKTGTQIAAELNMTRTNLRAFEKTEAFRVTMLFLLEQATRPGHDASIERRLTERAEWNSLAAKSLDYYREAFARDENGEYLSVERAERAAKLVAEGQGWTEPEPQAQKPQTIKLGVIQAAMAAIAATDRGDTVVRLQLDVQTRHEGDHPGEV